MTLSFVAQLLIVWIILVSSLGLSGLVLIANAQPRRRGA